MTAATDNGPREWDAASYDEVSAPQLEWGLEVLERVELRGDEVVVDAGSGTGRVTAALCDRIDPAEGGRVWAVDGSRAMVERAREHLGERAIHRVMDLTELEIDEPADLVFSTATFHWISDHDRLFARIAAALRPGGRLVAQCGGSGNVARHAEAIGRAAARPEFGAGGFDGISALWNFAEPGETEKRLRGAGFRQARAWLEPKLVQPSDPFAFLSTVTLGAHLDRLPPELHRPFTEAVISEMDDPVTLDYVRLNIEATR